MSGVSHFQNLSKQHSSLAGNPHFPAQADLRTFIWNRRNEQTTRNWIICFRPQRLSSPAAKHSSHAFMSMPLPTPSPSPSPPSDTQTLTPRGSALLWWFWRNCMGCFCFWGPEGITRISSDPNVRVRDHMSQPSNKASKLNQPSCLPLWKNVGWEWFPVCLQAETEIKHPRKSPNSL